MGIDLVPYKFCSLNCIYCECGSTTNLTIERKEYVSPEEVLNEIFEYLENNQYPEFITFSGSGEPTLNNKIGNIINFIKGKYYDIPIAVLTNGTLLHQKSVRNELKNADLVIPSLDASSESTEQK